jgi:hypothetical protein
MTDFASNYTSTVSSDNGSTVMASRPFRQTLATTQHQQDQEGLSVQGPEPRTVPTVMTTSIGWILQGGVLLSVVLIVLGLLL